MAANWPLPSRHAWIDGTIRRQEARTSESLSARQPRSFVVAGGEAVFDKVASATASVTGAGLVLDTPVHARGQRNQIADPVVGLVSVDVVNLLAFQIFVANALGQRSSMSALPRLAVLIKELCIPVTLPRAQWGASPSR